MSLYRPPPLMDAFEAIVLGIVQGLTEFLPISSSGHLRIVPAMAGWEDPGAAFTAVIQLGTMAAVLLYFRKDLIAIARGWFAGLRDPSVRGTLDSRMGWYLIVGTIPIVIFGFAFDDQIENDARNLTLIGITLIVLGLVLWLADHLGEAHPRGRERHLARLADHRRRAGRRARAGGLAQRRDDHRGPLPRLRPCGRGALLVPAVRPRRRPVRALPAARHRGRGGGRLRAHRARHDRRVRLRLRVDRVPLEVPDDPYPRCVRRLPRDLGRRRARPRRAPT